MWRQPAYSTPSSITNRTSPVKQPARIGKDFWKLPPRSTARHATCHRPRISDNTRFGRKLQAFCSKTRPIRPNTGHKKRRDPPGGPRRISPQNVGRSGLTALYHLYSNPIFSPWAQKSVSWNANAGTSGPVNGTCGGGSKFGLTFGSIWSPGRTTWLQYMNV